jgi:hypothetical protein
MSHEDPHAHGAHASAGPGGQEMSEEELRAQLEEELRRISVRDVLLQTVVSLVNLAGQRLGLGEGGAETRDLDQVRLAIEGVRALMPLLEQENPEQVRPVRDALSQLQMVYAREVGGAGAPPGEGGAAPAGGGAPEPGPPEPPPRQGGTGGLWVPPGSAT